jgi:AraC-like DNA-binding protein
MPLPQIPLAAHRAFFESTVEGLHSTVESRLGARCIAAPTERPISALANAHRTPLGELWFCSYGDPVKIQFRESNYFRVQFPHAGGGSTKIGTRDFEVVPQRGCISSGAATLSFGSNFQQLVWRVNRQALAQKLAAITGAYLPKPLEFAPSLDLSLPRARALLGILNSMVHHVSTMRQSNDFLLAELEQALTVSLLSHADHSCSPLLHARSPDPAPWQIRRVEEYIEANLDKPFEIEKAASLTGCAARTIYRAFRRHRGCSPAEFSKRRRLAKALAMLRNPPRELSVTEVAYQCGFNDLSHFSRDFSRAFGASPSAIRSSGLFVEQAVDGEG